LIFLFNIPKQIARGLSIDAELPRCT